jgi:8-oxo-dGTP pyrophosphatase MutT (NUDIX family)
MMDDRRYLHRLLSDKPATNFRQAVLVEEIMRSAVIIVEDDRVALIERVRDGRTYYVFPGGTVEADETTEAAAIREAYEELGVHVQLLALAAVVTFQAEEQYYYLAAISGGRFGTGMGEEFTSVATLARGTYRPVWLPRRDLERYDVRPHALAQALSEGILTAMMQPLYIHDGS